MSGVPFLKPARFIGVWSRALLAANRILAQNAAGRVCYWPHAGRIRPGGVSGMTGDYEFGKPRLGDVSWKARGLVSGV